MKRLAVIVVLLAGCYDPQALDCTVSCSASGDCAKGQVCGTDGYCASPTAAGHCGGPDGGVIAQLVTLRVSLNGPGKVTVDTIGVCDGDTEKDGACSFSVHPGVSLSLKAEPSGDHEFRSWADACSGSSSTCSLTPVTATTQVGARFE